MGLGNKDAWALLQPGLYAQAALRVTPPLLLCVLLPAITQQHQQHQRQEWWMHGGMVAACNMLKVVSLLATAVGLSADISNHMTEAEAAKAQRLAYQSRRRASRVTIKVPGAHPEQLPASFHADVQQRLLAHWPPAHHRLSVREGCVIVELDLARSASSTLTDASGDSLSAAEWLDVLQLDSLDGLAVGQVVSVQIDGQLSFMKFDDRTRRWGVVVDAAGAAASFLQLESKCLALDSRAAWLALDLSALAGEEVEFEAVLGGAHQPCQPVEGSGVGEGAQVLEMDLGGAWPGLLRCNAWSRPTAVQPTSRLLASMSVLLLPAGCGAAAAELACAAAASDAGTMLAVCADLGELIEAAAAQPTAADAAELAVSAAALAAWCAGAGYDALGLLVEQHAQRLLTGQPAAAVGREAPEVPAPEAPTPPPPPPPREGRSTYSSVAAAAHALDAALPAVCRAELRSGAPPPRLWALLVMLKCCAAAVRSVTSGAGLPELLPLALWALPYVFILASPGTAATPQHTHWLARHSRVFLHLHRSLLIALMGLGHLATPFVFKITTAGLDLPAKLLYMVTEAYDYRLAVLCILLVDLPAFYALYCRLGVPYAAVHVAALGLLGVAVQLGMGAWCARCDAHRRLAGAKKTA